MWRLAGNRRRILYGSLFEDGSKRAGNVWHRRGHLWSATFARRRQFGRHRIAADEWAEHSINDKDWPLPLPVVCAVVVGILLAHLESARLLNQLVEYPRQIFGFTFARFSRRNFAKNAGKTSGQFLSFGRLHLETHNKNYVTFSLVRCTWGTNFLLLESTGLLSLVSTLFV